MPWSLTCPEQEVWTQVAAAGIHNEADFGLLYINRTLNRREHQKRRSHALRVVNTRVGAHHVFSRRRFQPPEHAGVQKEDEEETLRAAEGGGPPSQPSRPECPDVGRQSLGRCVRRSMSPLPVSHLPCVTASINFLPTDHAQINDLSQVPVPVMLLPDDFRASTKIKVNNHLFNKYCAAAAGTFILLFISLRVLISDCRPL